MSGVLVEAIRQIYWNIGHGVVIPTCAAFGVLAWGFPH